MTTASGHRTAKVAVAAATFAIDRPYQYIIPSSLYDLAVPGVRVLAPFGRSNKLSEGIILSISDSTDLSKLKVITSVLDSEPVLDSAGIKLAAWVSRRYLCTLFEAVSITLPAGIWHSIRHFWRANPAAPVVEIDSRDLSVYRYIADSDGGVTEQLLKQAIGQDPAASIRRLAAINAIMRDGTAKTSVSDKMDFAIQLAISKDEAYKYINGSKCKSSRTRALIEFLIRADKSSARDALYFSGADSAIVRRLEKQGIVSRLAYEVYRRPEIDINISNDSFILNDEQRRVFDSLTALAGSPDPNVSLLHGVTGSGKTLVYISLIRHVVDSGGGVIVLAPEISLTPQLVSRFASIFGERVALLHSSLSDGERYDEWKRVRSGQASIVVGTRSAIFAPVKNLRLVIIDEEHERAYKSENSPRYHARDVAKYRISRQNGLLLLGSATPSIETMHAAESGRYKYFRLNSRFNERDLPEVTIVDMRTEMENGNFSTLSAPLCSELEANIASNEQSILFLNRRGDSKLVACTSCGHIPGCPRCSVSLNYHSANNRLMCHYCGYSDPLPTYCPECDGKFQRIGFGTQKAESEIQSLFPGIKLIRMDSDTTGAKNSHAKLLTKFRDEHTPVLIGTQMVAKGLDFENVTLVGALSADQSLYTGDYRASERTFSLLTQVVGRAGRGSKPGRALIQTITPQNPTLLCAAEQDYDKFYQCEIELRRSLNYPPFSDLCGIVFSGLDEDAVVRTALSFRQSLDHVAATNPGLKISAMGPAPAGVLKVNNRYRYRVLMKCVNDLQTREMVAGLLRRFSTDRRFTSVSIFADFDPE